MLCCIVSVWQEREKIMAKVYAFLADGLEEVECLAVVDVLRRSGVEVTLVSVTGDRKVTGSHGIELGTDALFEDVNPDVQMCCFCPEECRELTI